jgi:predicted ATPase
MNNWYVITGAPCSGKTTVIEVLEKGGHVVVHESARKYIDQAMASGMTIEDIRANESLFQENILNMKLEIEESLDPSKTIFFDRGIPDSTAYFRFCGIEPNGEMKKKLSGGKYKKVFLLDQIPYQKDYARTETEEEQNRLHELLEEAYVELGFEVIRVPVLLVEDRVNFILQNL